MTVYENLASGLKLKKIPAAEIKQRVAEVARVLGLELNEPQAWANVWGQRQRVAVGRALVRRSSVLLDEPLSNLDALLRERVRADIKHSSAKVPVVYIYDQTER